MAWQGSKNNPVPSIGNAKGPISETIAQQSSNLSEKKTDVNRAHQVRRDTDKQKDNTVKLIDIDTAIMRQLEKFQLMVTDEGKQIKVPMYYASPEKWKSIQKDGVIRDYNGKLVLPALVYQRITSAKDEAMMMFNRYLTYPVMRQYSEKNRYTKFKSLCGKNIPVREIYDVVMPDHMVFTYHFIVWTEYIEQMNTIVERINFETEDYWGDERGLRFRTKIDSFSHTIELQVDQDRMVKTEFDLLVNGYLLPDVTDKFQGKTGTTHKWFSPKKVIMGVEVVATSFDPDAVPDNNLQKWRNPNYPNLPALEPIPALPITLKNNIIVGNVHQAIQGAINGTTPFHFPPPISSNDAGQEGWVSYDNDYYYVYTQGKWKRVPIALFNDSMDF